MSELKSNKFFTFVGMAFVLALVAAGIFLPLQNVNSQEVIADGDGDDDSDDLRTISASGTSEISHAPEKVDVYVSIWTDNVKALESQTQNAQTSAEVIAALKAIGVLESDIETVSYTLTEQREWDTFSQKYVRKAFRTTNSLKISSNDIEAAGEIIDAATGAGANEVSSIVFGLTDETIKELKLQALEEASADTKIKAQAMANGVGVSIVQLETMSESSAVYYPQYRSYDAAIGIAESASAPTQVYAGDIKVSANVQATYSIQ